jgi:hypothetical protein
MEVTRHNCKPRPHNWSRSGMYHRNCRFLPMARMSFHHIGHWLNMSSVQGSTRDESWIYPACTSCATSEKYALWSRVSVGGVGDDFTGAVKRSCRLCLTMYRHERGRERERKKEREAKPQLNQSPTKPIQTRRLGLTLEPERCPTHCVVVKNSTITAANALCTQSTPLSALQNCLRSMSPRVHNRG